MQSSFVIGLFEKYKVTSFENFEITKNVEGNSVCVLKITILLSLELIRNFNKKRLVGRWDT